MNHPIIAITCLSKNFGAVCALDNISANIRPGIITGLVGPDGTGKTTLLRLLAGLLCPTTGEILILNQNPAHNPEFVRQHLGYMPQRFGLYEDLTVMENLKLYARLKGLALAEQAETFSRLLAFTDLTRFKTRLAGNLSGGMKQKLGLACTLLRKPRILLLDEPGVGVDPLSRRELWEMVRSWADQDTAVLWSTAYLDEAEQADQILLLQKGRLILNGSPGFYTARLKNRVFELPLCGEGQQKQQTTTRIMALPSFSDASVRGNKLRLVLKKGEALPDLSCFISAQPQPVQPAFADVFNDILAQKPVLESSLAEAYPNVKLNQTSEFAVEARHLSKRYGAFQAANDISFQISPGEIFGLLGPNGAGKTTVFKMMCGLSRPTSGRALVAGMDLSKAPGKARSRLGYMAQKFSLYGNLSVQQNLDFYAAIYGLKGAARAKAVQSMTEIFDLAPYLSENAAQAPLGFKQRLSLACALMHEPDVLFLDEPTSGVDPLIRREFWQHINGLAAKGVAVMVTTHFMDEAINCHRIALVNQGVVVALGDPDHLSKAAGLTTDQGASLEEVFIALVQKQRSAA